MKETGQTEVLISDDEAENLKTLEKLFRIHGSKVRICSVI